MSVKPRRRASAYAKAATDYAKDVVAGRVPACRYVRLACERFLDALRRQKDRAYPYRLDRAAADRVCRFVELMPHVKGKWARDRERIKLQGWQCFVDVNVWGWKRKADGHRRYREVYIEVPRKNAKSTLTAANGNYMFAADGEHGAEVYSGATTEKQAWEVFGPARLMAKNTEAFREQFGVHVGAKNLHILEKASKFEPLIGKPGDGASPSFAIHDEYHEHQTSDQRDTMITGMGAREQPIDWVITTAGSNTAGPCYALRAQAIEMLEGKVQRDELFALIYTIDEGDDWTAETALWKANPNMGVSVFADFLRTEQRKAIASPRDQATFKTKHLNVWVTAASPYFDAELWAKLNDAPPVEEFRGQEYVNGLDLASKLDLAADVRLFWRDRDGSVCAKCHGEGSVPGDEAPSPCDRCDGSGRRTERHYFTYGRFYVPLSRTEAPENRHYAGWAEEGHLIATPGDITDYDYIEADLRATAERHVLRRLGADPHNATQLLTHLQQALGADRVIEVPQNVGQLSEPMKEVQALIVDGRIHHDGNPCFAWQVGNVTAQEDRNQNVFPRKEAVEKKIDGAVALIIAMGLALRLADEPRSVGWLL